MTVYSYSRVLVWDNLGGSVKVARNQRVDVTDPATGLVAAGLTVKGQPVPYVMSDGDGHVTFSSTMGLVRLTSQRGFWQDVESPDLRSGAMQAAVDAAAAKDSAAASATAAQTAATNAATQTLAGAQSRLDSAAAAAASSATAAQNSANLVGAPADTAIAAAVNGATSQTRGALDGRYPKKADLPVSVKDYGAKGDGVTDDTSAIQSAINAVRDAVRAGFTLVNVVTIPMGRYKITSTITCPPYVKLRSLGQVILDWAGGDSTCLLLTPLSSDPTTLYSGLTKTQWLDAPLIDGSCGGFIINNTGAIGASVGLEVGSRTNLGTSRPLARYSVNDVSIQGFNVLQRMNIYNHYIGSYRNMHYEPGGAVGIQFGTSGATQANSGENFRWFASLISGVSAAIEVNVIGIDISFYGMSIDFCDRVLTVTTGYGKINFYGGHIEAINASLNAAHGVIVSTATGGSNFASVTFQGTAMLVKSQPFFRGTNLVLQGTFEGRVYSGDINTAYPNSIMAEATVSCADLHNVATREHRILSRSHNLLEDPLFQLETIGAISGDLLLWSVAKAGGATLSVVATSPESGGRSLQMSLPPGGAITLTAKYGTPLRNRAYTRYTNVAFQTDRSGVTVSCGASFQGPSGATLGSDPAFTLFQADLLPAGSFQIPNYSRRISDTYMYRASSVLPNYQFYNPAAATGTATVLVPFLYFGE